MLVRRVVTPDCGCVQIKITECTAGNINTAGVRLAKRGNYSWKMLQWDFKLMHENVFFFFFLPTFQLDLNIVSSISCSLSSLQTGVGIMRPTPTPILLAETSDIISLADTFKSMKIYSCPAFFCLSLHKYLQLSRMAQAFSLLPMLPTHDGYIFLMLVVNCFLTYRLPKQFVCFEQSRHK